MRFQFVKLAIVGDELLESLVERVDENSIRTIEVLRKRNATDREKYFSRSGYGWLVDFDDPKF